MLKKNLGDFNSVNVGMDVIIEYDEADQVMAHNDAWNMIDKELKNQVEAAEVEKMVEPDKTPSKPAVVAPVDSESKTTGHVCNKCGAPAEFRTGVKDGKPWSGVFCSTKIRDHVAWIKD